MYYYIAMMYLDMDFLIDPAGDLMGGICELQSVLEKSINISENYFISILTLLWICD